MSFLKNSRLAIIAGAVAASTLFSGSANALLLDSWTKVSTSTNTNVGNQLAVDVTDAGSNRVTFRFTNNVGIASSVTDVYFDDKSVSLLAGVFSITDSGAGVDFSEGADPANLPSGNTVNFAADFSADSNTPNPVNNGINTASEWLDITFNLVGGKTFADVLAQINSGELVIGMHVQSIAPQGGSDAYVNGTSTTQVPEPATLAVLGMGLLGLGAVRRRKA